jgi:hypothetical protein
MAGLAEVLRSNEQANAKRYGGLVGLLLSEEDSQGYNPFMKQTPGAEGNNPMALNTGGQPIPKAPHWVNSLTGLVEGSVNGFMAPYNAMTGKYDQFVIDPETGKVLSMIDPRLMDDAAAMAGLVTTSGMPMPKPAGALGIFGGTMAKTADTAALAKAQQMAESGVSRKKIWTETGWFKGTDGKWRFEIPDNKADYDPESLLELKQNAADDGRQFDGLKDTYPLDHVFDHRELFSAYPDMAGIPTHFIDDLGGKGAYAPKLDRLSLNAENSADEMLPIGLHEMQHGVQKREGFAAGGNPSEFYPEELINKSQSLDAEADSLLRKSWDAKTPEERAEFRRESETMFAEAQTLKQKAAEWRRDQYKRLAGEVEARNVETRRKLTPEQRRAKAPWLTQDVADELQILRFRP